MTTSKFSLAFGAAAVLAAACAEAPSSVSPDASMHAAHITEASAAAVASPGLLKQVSAVAARYHSTKQAEKAGYVADPTCVAVPTLGGMGHHWVNTSLVDPVFNPLEPEVVLYAPDKHGNMKLVAVEYIVIQTPNATRPSFDGYQFDIGGTPVPVPHWSLHVWAYRDNPNGVHTPFNPSVDCTP